MDKKTLIGAKIREIRKKSGFTQELFSEKIGIEPASLSNIENGKSYPSMQTVLNILDKFDILPQNFFDMDYLQNPPELEKEIFSIIKNLPTDRKRILYRIVKSFNT